MAYLAKIHFADPQSESGPNMPMAIGFYGKFSKYQFSI